MTGKRLADKSPGAPFAAPRGHSGGSLAEFIVEFMRLSFRVSEMDMDDDIAEVLPEFNADETPEGRKVDLMDRRLVATIQRLGSPVAFYVGEHPSQPAGHCCVIATVIGPLIGIDSEDEYDDWIEYGSVREAAAAGAVNAYLLTPDGDPISESD